MKPNQEHWFLVLMMMTATLLVTLVFTSLDLEWFAVVTAALGIFWAIWFGITLLTRQDHSRGGIGI